MQRRNAVPVSLAALFVAGPHPTIADCTLAAAFQFAWFGGVEIAPAFASLARWNRAFRERPEARSVLLA